MGEINITKTYIDGLYVIEPKIYKDERGCFFESYNDRDMIEAGLDMKFVQDNQSESVKGVLRGMHFQRTHPQGKLVRVIEGTVYDVAVDMRTNSPTYLKWYGVELSGDNYKQFYIPEGFAHGFLVLSDKAKFCYKCTDYYCPGDDGGILWNDSKVNINWPIKENKLIDGTPLIINERDSKWDFL